jgi:2-phosphosulfolactate phosphatase
LAARIDLQHKVHVLSKKEELDSVRLPGQGGGGARHHLRHHHHGDGARARRERIVPVLDETAARAARARRRLRALGELFAETLPGFVHPAPLALSPRRPGQERVYSTPTAPSP